jgi:hypothetical protein
VAKFLRLGKHFPTLIATEEDKARKFQKGLRRDIGGRFAHVRPTTMDQVIDMATTAETFNNEKKTDKVAREAPTVDDRPAKKPFAPAFKPPPVPNNNFQKNKAQSQVSTWSKTQVKSTRGFPTFD